MLDVAPQWSYMYISVHNLKQQRPYYRKLVGTDIINLLYNAEREVHKLKPLRLQLAGQERTVGEDNNWSQGDHSLIIHGS